MRLGAIAGRNDALPSLSPQGEAQGQEAVDNHRAESSIGRCAFRDHGVEYVTTTNLPYTLLVGALDQQPLVAPGNDVPQSPQIRIQLPRLFNGLMNGPQALRAEVLR